MSYLNNPDIVSELVYLFSDLFVNATILISFVSVCGAVLKNYPFNPQKLKHQIYFGIANGSLGVILMLNSIKITPDIIIDFRNVSVMISSLYGGAVSGVIAALIIGVSRSFLFGLTASSRTE